MANPVVTQYSSHPLALRDNKYEDVTLTAPGAVTYEPGRVLAFDASAGKWKITESGTAAVANAKAVLIEEAEFTGAGDRLSRVMIKGEVDENQLIFDGSDTPDTIPAGASDSFRTQLRAYGIILRSPAELTKEDT